MYQQTATTTTTTTISPSLSSIIRTTKDDNPSIMSINQLCNNTNTESDYPEDMKEAAATLEAMKQNTVTTNLPIEGESADSSSHPTPLEPSQASSNQTTDGSFMSRINNIGLVRKTMNVYEQGKANSPFIKYTTEMVESSVSMISRPVIDKIPQLAQLDQYACKGLDKLEEMMDSNNNNNNNNNDNNSNEIDIDNNHEDDNNKISFNNGINGINVSDNDECSGESRKRRARGSGDGHRSRSSSPSYRSSQRIHRSSQSSESENSYNTTSSSSSSTTTYSSNHHHNQIITSESSTISTNNNNNTTTAVTRNRWHQMLIGAGAAASAAGAAVSEESMKSLKYCLQWLQYATQHIDAQVTILRNFILSMTNPSASRALVPSSASATLSSIKKEVVDTLRRVIEVVSKYAGACLPDQAKRNVRSFILELPTRWAYMNHQDQSASPSPMSSPQLAPANTHPINQTTEYASRLLSLATESLDMLSSVTGTFSETVDKAEDWVEKLRYVGVTSGGSNALGQIHFDGIPQSYNNDNNNHHHQSSSGSRSRRSSNSARVNGIRKHSRKNK